MKIFPEVERDQIGLSFEKPFHCSLNKQNNGFSSYLFLTAWAKCTWFDASIFVIPLHDSIFCSRISTTYPSGYSPIKRGTPLGPTNPPLNYIAEETLGIRWHSFSLCSRYSYRHSHFWPLHHVLQHSFIATRTLPYQSRAKREEYKTKRFKWLITIFLWSYNP